MPLDGIELFAAAFFGFSPREAEALDPQQRFFLECAWAALENAGYDAHSYTGAIGVYAGIGGNGYISRVLANETLVRSLGRFSILLANDKDSLATSTAYRLNLKGPSLTIQTACSTSLVAVHVACQGIFAGDCDMALAGGVSIDVFQRRGYLHQEGDILSPDGHCRAFDARAQGTLAGSGVGVVVLKRLEEALADGDYVHAVIRGSAINNDGSAKVGYAAPSVEGQSRVIRAAQTVAEVEAESISYVEAHGTGTALGDPIEVAALTEAFRTYTDKKHFCAIGSVKTNIGHLNSAAGIIGLIKTVQALKHRQIPASLNFETPNPKTDFEKTPFYVNTSLTRWQGPRPLRAGVSSFGMGGTNAHVILQEAPEIPSTDIAHSAQLLVLSAKSASVLEKASHALSEYLACHPELSLIEVAYTLQVGRRPFDYRQMLLCNSRDEAIQVLNGTAPQKVKTAIASEGESSIVFLFPGQGTQAVNMGRDLYERFAIFRRVVDDCCEQLKPVLKVDLRHLIYPPSGSEEQAREQLQRTSITQPSLFVIEYALARLWMEWGVVPQAVIGHSVGEYVAACVAGIMDVEDALRLLAVRAQLMQSMPAGNMMAAQITEGAALKRLGPSLSLAAVNAPDQCVFSGTPEAIDELEKQLQTDDIFCRRLLTSHAFHSQMMDPVLDRFAREADKVRLRAPQIPCISNVTGTWMTSHEALDPGYWVRHLREPVRFAAGIQEILERSAKRIFVEAGPGHTLSALVRRQCRNGSGATTLASLPVKDQQKEIPFITETVGSLWLAGAGIDWQAFHQGNKRHRVPLPSYPFERSRHWIEPDAQQNGMHSTPLTQRRASVSDWFYLPYWGPSILPLRDQRGGPGSDWLVFMDEKSLSAKLVRELAACGGRICTVRVGEGFIEGKDGSYSIRPEQSQDYESLLGALRANNRLPSHILHLWGVSQDENPRLDGRSQDLSLRSLLLVAQTFGQESTARKTELIVLSNNAQAVTMDERVCPEKAATIGACRVIAKEHPNLTCRNIDFVAPQQPFQEQRIIKQLLAEMASGSSDSLVAYRGQQRWVRDFAAVHIEKQQGQATWLREKGVYLITGRLGEANLEIASYLVGMETHVVLGVPPNFPREEQWKHWLTEYDAQHPTCRQIAQIQALQHSGAEIRIVESDAGNSQQVQKLVRETRQYFGAINGTIHFAGGEEAGVGKCEVISLGDCESAFQRDADWLFAFAESLKDHPPDFSLVFTSLANMTGTKMSWKDTAASWYMQGLVQNLRRDSSWVWSHVQWDMPAFVAGEEKYGEFSSEIMPSQGIQAFDRMVHADLVPEIMVCPHHAAFGFMSHVESGHSQNAETALVPEISSYSRPAVASAYVPPVDKIEVAICGIWQELLGIGQIGIHDNFFDLGGNSLIATQLLSRLQRNVSPEIPLRMVFDNATVAELAAAIRSSLPVVFENSPAGEKQNHPLGSEGDDVPRLRSRKAKAKATALPLSDEPVCGPKKADAAPAEDCAEELMAPSAKGGK
jgi:acyl transferase domain-containing protein